MNYATTYHKGNAKATQDRKAGATAQPTRRVRPLDATAKGRKRNPKGQAKASSKGNVANGFLSTSFLPKLQETKAVEDGRKPTILERDFYTSLSQLAGRYGIDTMPTQSVGYPTNVALALSDAEQQLKAKVSNFYGLRMVQDDEKTYLIVDESYNTGATLYYIPIVPLHRMLKDPQHRKAGHLLLSVCAYLYRSAGVPYFKEDDSYLYWQYEMLKEWVLTDEQTDETEVYLNEIIEAEWVGDVMGQKIGNKANLTYFQQRLEGFSPKGSTHEGCLEIAKEAFALYQQYPDTAYFQNAAPQIGSDTDGDYLLTMDRYVGFCAETRGWLGANLIECINNEFQEYGEMQEPVMAQHFNGSEPKGDSLEFENRFFALLEELIYLLNNYDNI